tara:strand:- start:686 stop:790 length:105 start_codon:yes stop_codon:yes gene_type:complete
MIAMIMVFALSACGEKEADTSADTDEAKETTTQE